MNPTLEQLAQYAMQELERGVPESTLRTALLQNGWTMDWVTAAFSAAKQRAIPATNQLTMPPVQAASSQPVQPRVTATLQPAVPDEPEDQTKPAPKPQTPEIKPQPQLPAFQPDRRPQSLTPARPASRTKPALSLKTILMIVVAVLGVLFVVAGIYRITVNMHTASQQRTLRDEERRDDLAVLLSNLSDYYVTHSSYPTRDQMNTTTFLQANSFGADSTKDPKWPNEACTKNNKPIFTQVPTENCYAYKATTSKGSDCDNGTKPCTRIKLTISLETGDKQYAVTFDKNSQIN